MRKKTFRLAAALLAFCIAASLFPPVGLAAENEGYFDLTGAINQADSGGTVTLPSDAMIISSDGEAPWIIPKNITIDGQGHKIILRAGGVLLGGDVTIQNARLDFTTSTRNAVIANGYALTLDSVTAAGYPFNVFGGTLFPNDYEQFPVPSPGTANTVTIQGTTSLQGTSEHVVGRGNIYAGSLCMGGMGPDTGHQDGPVNSFDGDPVIRIDGCASLSGGASAVGSIYAGGAQQKNPPNVDGQKVTRPDPAKYTVNGTVTITGTQLSKVSGVDGAGATETRVEYEGVNQDTKVYSDISSLSVGSGNLVLAQGSSFRQDRNASLSISSGAKLTVSNLNNFTVDDFTAEGAGGGILVMGADQTMTAAQSAEGSATVAIGGTNNLNTNSTSQPTVGHTYIQTPASSGAAFQLLPYSLKPGVRLERDANGSWTAVDDSSGGDGDLVKDFSFDTAAQTVEAGGEAEFPLTVESANGVPVYLEYIPLGITINDKAASPNAEQNECGETYYTYSYSGSFGQFFMEINANNLYVYPDESCDPGDYTIRIIVPKEHMVGGKALFKDAKLTVTKSGGGDPDPGPVDPVLDSISVNSTGHKTAYQVGEALDVSGLTIEAAYSDG